MQLVTLAYAFMHIRSSLVELSEAANMFVANEIRMYTQIILSLATILSGLFANLLTLRARSLELDNDSIGSQERYYNGWTKPVYMWSLHYIMLIGFISSIFFALLKAGQQSQIESFDQAAKKYE